MVIDTTKYNNITSNTIRTAGSSGHGIVLGSEGFYNNFTSNTIITSGTTAFGISIAETSNNIFDSNTITTNASGSYGIYLSDADFTNFTSDNINATDAEEIYSLSTSTDNKFTNVVLLGEPILSSNSFNSISIDVNLTPVADKPGTNNLSDFLNIKN